MNPEIDEAAVRRTSTITIALLMGVYVIDYIDRVMIGVALPFLGADLGIDKTQQGLVVSAFAIAYMVFQVPGGLLADRFGARPLLVVSLVAWSVFTAATGFVGGLVALLVVRALFGVAQALFPGASFKALAERTPPGTRNRSAGLMLASNFLGAGIAPFTVYQSLAMAFSGGAEEIVRAAGETGAHMHYCHVNSTSLRHVDRVHALVERARANGATVTTEAYPYGTGMTGIGAAFLAPELLHRRDIGPSAIQHLATGRRMADEAELRRMRSTNDGDWVLVHMLDESDPSARAVLQRALVFPDTAVASDAASPIWRTTPTRCAGRCPRTR